MLHMCTYRIPTSPPTPLLSLRWKTALAAWAGPGEQLKQDIVPLPTDPPAPLERAIHPLPLKCHFTPPPPDVNIGAHAIEFGAYPVVDPGLHFFIKKIQDSPSQL